MSALLFCNGPNSPEDCLSSGATSYPPLARVITARMSVIRASFFARMSQASRAFTRMRSKWL